MVSKEQGMLKKTFLGSKKIKHLFSQRSVSINKFINWYKKNFWQLKTSLSMFGLEVPFLAGILQPSNQKARDKI